MKKTFISFATLVTAVTVLAQTYSNGPLSTGATSSNGTAAPAGYTWSEVQVPNTTAGVNASVLPTAAYSMADDFVIPANEQWNITKMDFFGYQTGAVADPFSQAYVQLYNGKPDTGGTLVHGNLTTNVLAAVTNASMYRIFNATPGNTRIVWRLSTNVTKSLTPGTYWVNFSTLTKNSSSAFFPMVTIPGQASPAGANAIQYIGTGWQAIVDGPTGNQTNPQAVPFVITYTVTTMATTETRQFDSRMVVYPNPTKDSFKINMPQESKTSAKSVELFDMTGKLVKTFPISESYNIKELSKGAYLIKVKGSDVVKATRIVKE